jgi:hydroxysqualene dehydroxylase
MRVAIIGAGWAGLAAAVEATRAGHKVTVFEASRTLGGRARAVAGSLPDGRQVVLDNGQHILIGAYHETLRLMALVGADTRAGLLRLPLALQFPDGQGIKFPPWPAPLNALGGICLARGWSLFDKFSLLTAAATWQRQKFTCASEVTVAQLCSALRPRIMTELIEPLCVSALNTPADRASGQVFLRVMRDALFGDSGSSNLLLPRLDLSRLFPQAAAEWLEMQGAQLRMATRVEALAPGAIQDTWLIDKEPFERVILATSSSNAIQAVRESTKFAINIIALKMRSWIDITQALHFEAITTVYAYAPEARLPAAMLTLRNAPQIVSNGRTGLRHPAQFVFDRGQLGGPAGLLAFVVSASTGEREVLEAAVLAQAREQLGLTLAAIQTIVEKRATFACTPALVRPPTRVAPGLLACGDYCEGPYPATLEGAVRSAVAAVQALPSA